VHRRDGFVAEAERAGVRVHVHEVGLAILGRPDAAWQVEDEALRVFIRSLPEPPVGAFASNDGRAIQFMEAGRELGLSVPDEVAVLGCDNDDLLCELARPPLSSVVVASERVGYEAALVLNRLIRKEKKVPRYTAIPPVRIVTRQSSEIMAVDDADLARALRYIRANAHRAFKGDEVVKEVMIARRSLERRFTSRLGRTLHDEIQRAHIDQAKQLLAHTDLPMPDIAERSGFGSLRTLSLVFRKEVGSTPSAFRRKHRLR
jgi:LacI family transcriptional regulator